MKMVPKPGLTLEEIRHILVERICYYKSELVVATVQMDDVQCQILRDEISLLSEWKDVVQSTISSRFERRQMERHISLSRYN